MFKVLGKRQKKFIYLNGIYLFLLKIFFEFMKIHLNFTFLANYLSKRGKNNKYINYYSSLRSILNHKFSLEMSF